MTRATIEDNNVRPERPPATRAAQHGFSLRALTINTNSVYLERRRVDESFGFVSGDESDDEILETLLSSPPPSRERTSALVPPEPLKVVGLLTTPRGITTLPLGGVIEFDLGATGDSALQMEGPEGGTAPALNTVPERCPAPQIVSSNAPLPRPRGVVQSKSHDCVGPRPLSKEQLIRAHRPSVAGRAVSHEFGVASARPFSSYAGL